MNLYNRLKDHLARYAYKRGQFKGEAPADASRRKRNWSRVRAGADGAMEVVFHRTSIIKALPDGTMTLNTNQYDNSPTTREAMNEWLSHCELCIASERRGNYSNTALFDRVNKRVIAYYDGMALNYNTNERLSKPGAWKRYVADKEARAELRQAIKDSGFLDVFPLLYSETQPDARRGPMTLHDAMFQRAQVEHYAAHWAEYISSYKWQWQWDYKAQKSESVERYEDWRQCRNAMLAPMMKRLRRVVIESDV